MNAYEQKSNLRTNQDFTLAAEENHAEARHAEARHAEAGGHVEAGGHAEPKDAEAVAALVVSQSSRGPK